MRWLFLYRLANGTIEFWVEAGECYLCATISTTTSKKYFFQSLLIDKFLRKCIEYCISSQFDVLWSSSTLSLFDFTTRNWTLTNDRCRWRREHKRCNGTTFEIKYSLAVAKMQPRLYTIVRTHKQTEPENKNKKNRPTNFINTLSLNKLTKRAHASKIDANLTEPNSTLIKWKFAWRNKTQAHAHTQTKIKNLFANENFTAAFYTLRIFRRVYS